MAATSLMSQISKNHSGSRPRPSRGRSARPSGAKPRRFVWNTWIGGFPDNRLEIIAIHADDRGGVHEGRFVGTHAGTLPGPAGEIAATGLDGRRRALFAGVLRIRGGQDHQLPPVLRPGGTVHSARPRRREHGRQHVTGWPTGGAGAPHGGRPAPPGTVLPAGFGPVGSRQRLNRSNCGEGQGRRPRGTRAVARPSACPPTAGPAQKHRSGEPWELMRAESPDTRNPGISGEVRGNNACCMERASSASRLMRSRCWRSSPKRRAL